MRYAGRFDRKVTTSALEVMGVSRPPMKGSPLMGLMTWSCCGAPSGGGGGERGGVAGKGLSFDLDVSTNREQNPKRRIVVQVLFQGSRGAGPGAAWPPVDWALGGGGDSGAMPPALRPGRGPTAPGEGVEKGPPPTNKRGALAVERADPDKEALRSIRARQKAAELRGRWGQSR